MISNDDLSGVLDNNGVITTSEGDKIGKIGQIYLNDQTGEPEWVTVKTGLFGTAESFVPLQSATITGDSDLSVPFSKDQVKDAPRVEADGQISPDEEDQLYRYYGIGSTAGEATPQRQATTEQADDAGQRTDLAGQPGIVGADTSGPTTDQSMTRSEERLHVGTQQVEAGRARLRKYIVSEEVTQTVPVSHDEVTLEREPITADNMGDAMSGGELTEEVHEVVLNADQVVTEKEVVPVERIKLGTQTVTEDQTVTEQVRKEQVETEQTGTNPTGTDQTGIGQDQA